MIPVGFGGASGGYSITNSVRANGTSAYLQKTLTTSATTSGSVWVKRSKLGAVSPIFDNKVYFTSGDALYAFGLTSTALYRDPSAGYHIFWNGTGVYVNGTLVAGSGVYLQTLTINPRLGFDGTNYFSGYLSDFAFWDGSSASLQGGATNSDGVWAAKRPSAGYSFLAFGSSGALGTDTSGNGNNWTVTGLTASDQMTDTPTNNGCVLNPLTTYLGAAPTTISNGSLTVTNGGANNNYSLVMGTVAVPASGKWVFRVDKPATSGVSGGGPANQYFAVGFEKASKFYTSASGFDYVFPADFCGVTDNGSILNFSSSPVNGNPGLGAAQSVEVLVDLTGNTITIKNNGASYYSGSITNPGEPVIPFIAIYNAGNVTSYFTNFTPSDTNYKTICTANLPSVAVTTSGTFTGNANADGPVIWTNGNPATLTINGNAVTFGTHADKTAGGFKLRSSSASYNTSGSNTWTATADKRFVYSATSINTAQGNP